MVVSNAFMVIIGALILGVGLYFAARIIGILRAYGLARSWIVLTTLISFFLLGYVFTALRFLEIDLMPAVTLKGLVTAIFFLGAVLPGKTIEGYASQLERVLCQVRSFQSNR